MLRKVFREDRGVTGWLPEGKFHPLVLIPAIITLAWSLCMVAAPLSLPAGSVEDLSGSVGIVDNANQTAGMNPFARWVYEGGDVNCHQKSSRSFYINGNEMPYCARDVGIFFGMAIGTMFSLYFRVELRLRHIVAGLLPIGIDGGMQLLGFWESINPVRVATGGLAGFVTGLALGYIFYVIECALRDRRIARAQATSGGAAAFGAQPRAQDAKDDVEDKYGRDQA